ncbi:hypothetical protein DSCO28_65150 [Desulfosarcina ovata subsp. sediminis]|uniref:Uracil-DNA glycosylase-like domain-containing protein n=1 Tax=Desulfosarcina ovata subsp. sediminis TaxID=885957 RepID=A0A5K8A097_9BACT|nr:hypothetical protein [Desulfosarcina ovata]BBO85949.1 hypothetical protein DSCO28_65150 [Desulfosarcina ovata subsp. sediminis]
MFKNCFGYLAGEVEIFQPQIIITQGGRARVALEKAKFPKLINIKNCLESNHKCTFTVINVSEKPVLVFYTYHPTSRAQYYPKYRDGYFSCFPKLAKDFVNSPSKFISGHSQR